LAVEKTDLRQILPGDGAPVQPGELEWALPRLEKLLTNLRSVIRGKNEATRLVVVGLLCRNHVLIEDIPGVGKTTLAKALARSLGGSFVRIQFTSDLLPSDILGVSIYTQETSEFVFKPGPVFTNVLLADEINRTNPRTQSALLEAMNEGQVSVDGVTHAVEPPFMVIATQNPHDFYGTFPLPESQLDRFMLRIKLGYPDESIERGIIAAGGGDEALSHVRPVLQSDEVKRMAAITERIRVDDLLLDYLMDIVRESREDRSLSLGISPRGGIHMYRAVQAIALLEGRTFAIPDDLQAVAVSVLSHRVIPSGGQATAPGERRRLAESILRDLLDRIPVPV
jgi:MoxR-like ATPase